MPRAERRRRGPPRALLRPAALAAALVAALGAAPGCADRAEPAPAGAPPGVPEASPLRRLNRREYANSVHALLGVDADVIHALVMPDPHVDGFENNTSVQSPSPLLLEQYRLAAQRAADDVLAGRGAPLPCAPKTPDEERACGHQIVQKLGRRAYRRPLEAAEITRFEAFFDASRSERGFDAAVKMFLQGILQSPSFVYRPDFAVPGAAPGSGAPARLTQHEIASRLSYFFHASMPDDDLLAAADKGQLADRADIERWARRMLDDKRAKNVVAEFHRQWLGLAALDGVFKDYSRFPHFDRSKSPPALRDATLRFIDHVFWEEGATLRALLTDTHAYVNDTLAPVYGVPAPGSDELSLVALDPTRRAGLLTQAGLLAALAHQAQTAPVKRGVFVLSRFLCAPPPAPPPGVTAGATKPPTGDQPLTSRQRFEQHQDGTCKTCHTSIDGIGFGFENYDALGEWQSTDNGLPVDASGALVGSDVDGPFNGAVELAERLADSQIVQACVVKKWFRFAFGRLEAPEDTCTLTALEGSFAASGGDMRELMIAIATSDAFLHRRPAAAEGDTQ